MTVNELGQLVKSKHPNADYSNFSDAEIGARTLSKYPEYRSQIGKPQDTGVVDAVKTAISNRPELQPFGKASIPESPTNPVSGAIDAATQTLGFPVRVGRTIEKGPSVAGEAIAEEGGRVGYPKTAAAVGTAVSMAPEILMARGGLKALYESSNPVARAIRTTPQELGPEYKALEERAGISGNLPERRGYIARFPKHEPQGLATRPPSPMVPGETVPEVPPSSYPRDPNSFINFARTRVKTFGDRLSPQELDDYKSELSTILADNRMRGTKQYAIASQLQKDVTGLHNKAIPGREDLNKVYALSKKLHPELGEILKKAAGKIWPHFRWGTILVP